MARRDALVDELVDLFLAEGFAKFSLAGLAQRLSCSKSTLYLVAPSKEQIVVAVVRSYFRRAAERVEARVAACGHPGERLAVYLEAVSAALQPASATFYADLAGFAPAGEVYRENTEFAARRVQDLVLEGVEAGVLRPADAAFVGAAAAQVMRAIQNGDIGSATGLDDAAAYLQLSDLVMHSLAQTSG